MLFFYLGPDEVGLAQLTDFFIKTGIAISIGLHGNPLISLREDHLDNEVVITFSDVISERRRDIDLSRIYIIFLVEQSVKMVVDLGFYIDEELFRSDILIR